MPQVIAYAIGTCHLKGQTDSTGALRAPAAGCDEGKWETVYAAQLLSFVAAAAVPAVDGYLEKVRAREVREFFGGALRCQSR